MPALDSSRRTAEVGLAPDPRAARGTSLESALLALGCRASPSGDASPPATRYVFGPSQNLSVEFITPQRGNGLRWDGTREDTIEFGGVVAQCLRHADLLALEPWTVELASGSETGGPPEFLRALVCNPPAFLAQKLLIADRRPHASRAKDVAYLYETLRLFSRALDELARVWSAVAGRLRPATKKEIEAHRSKLVRAPSDDLREAARLLASLDHARSPSAEELREALRLGLERVFAAR